MPMFLTSCTIVSEYGIYYSSDSGATWTQSSGAPTGSGIGIKGIASSASGQTMAAAARNGEINDAFFGI